MKGLTNYRALLILVIMISNSIGFCMFTYGMIIIYLPSQTNAILEPNKNYIERVNLGIDGGLLLDPNAKELVALTIDSLYKANKSYHILVENMVSQVKIYNILNTSLWIGVGLLIGFTARR